MVRLAKFWLPAATLTLVLSLPARSSAEPPSGCGPLGYYRGSYSCLHYWVPRLYTVRAYHRESGLNDSPPYDQFGSSYSWSSHSGPCTSASPAHSPEMKDNDSRKD